MSNSEHPTASYTTKTSANSQADLPRYSPLSQTKKIKISPFKVSLLSLNTMDSISRRKFPWQKTTKCFQQALASSWNTRSKKVMTVVSKWQRNSRLNLSEKRRYKWLTFNCRRKCRNWMMRIGTWSKGSISRSSLMQSTISKCSGARRWRTRNW